MEGSFFIVPEIMKTNCGICTEEEKDVVRRVTTHVRETRPEMWAEFSDRFDPERKFQI
ncbi:allergen Tha p 1-like isoform X2 [Coccinella septempunctata]|uniref:allergen Tha p 1-like isoform X2 n=1 Tax=Coccinella septempunctata TaxID=41139 RepID=UPI001D07D0AC|nr:allergen Tha p 1-like isoform X2 [Coccinella septempunctata]